MHPRLSSGGIDRPLNFTVRGLMSQRYEYSLALRIHHPSAAPGDISRALRMRPRVSWRVGDPRVLRDGTPMPGLRSDTYWSKTITPGGVKVRRSNVAEVRLAALVKRLQRNARFLRNLRRTGGRVEIWLGSYGTQNYSFIISPALIASFHTLGCQLIVDVYPYLLRWGA